MQWQCALWEKNHFGFPRIHFFTTIIPCVEAIQHCKMGHYSLYNFVGIDIKRGMSLEWVLYTYPGFVIVLVFLIPHIKLVYLAFFILLVSRYTSVPVLRSLMCFVSLSVGSTINYYMLLDSILKLALSCLSRPSKEKGGSICLSNVQRHHCNAVTANLRLQRLVKNNTSMNKASKVSEVLY